jgi:signal transduction histidine kinase
LVRDATGARAASTHNAHAVEAARWAGSAQTQTTVRQDDSQKPVVLVVDDNADLRLYMSDLLSAHYRVLTANDGCEALDRIRVAAPDLVVSDVMMPRMTGIELVQAIRSDPATVAIPIILLSARAGEEASAEGLDAGSDDYLTKPFTAHELRVRVRSHLQLAQARRKWISDLELANRELDAFSYSVAHDLRGPLRTIDGFSQILQDENAGQLDAEGLRRFDMIRTSVRRMTQLIDDLLNLARMGRSEVRRVPFDVSAVARTVALQLRASKPERTVELVIAEPTKCHADPHLVQIALENLLGNAWKFTAKRLDARIEFGSREQDGELCFFIRDNGAGFDEKYVSKLFGVFQRLHTDSEFQGTGVGLATVKRIIARHGGRVWAEGEVGEGATFYFTLGAADVAAQSWQSAAAGERAAG